MVLKDYPRPLQDTGWGLHDSALVHQMPADPEGFAQMLADIGFRWFKVLAWGANPSTGLPTGQAGSGHSKLDFCRVLKAKGLEPIVRLYQAEPHPNYVADPVLVRAYVEAGVNYFEWGNEPNIWSEWEGGRAWDAAPERVVEQWKANAEVIAAAGGIALFPALAPGGNDDHAAFYRAAFAAMEQGGLVEWFKGQRIAFAVHNRPLGRPLDYPAGTGATLDQDSTGFRLYEWLDELVQRYFGESYPLLGTEGGQDWSSPDGRYPPIDLPRHTAMNLEVFQGFQTGQWRPALFCVCYWEAGSYDGSTPDAWMDDWLLHNRKVAGAELPLVAALRAEPRFVRRMPWDGSTSLVVSPSSGSPPREEEVATAVRVLFPDGAVQELDIDAYAKGVLPYEMATGWPQEALKAQAVAAKSYALASHRHPDANVCTTDHCQVYGPLRYADTDAAVDAVRGVFIGLEGRVVPAFYFGHCSGRTRNSEDAGWSYRSYLRSVECPAQYSDLYGHGVGMCQQGARVMAERDAAFDAILRHYYTGIEIAAGASTSPPEDQPNGSRREEKLRDVVALWVEGVDDYRSLGFQAYIRAFQPDVAVVWSPQAARQYARVLVMGNNVPEEQVQSVRETGSIVRRVAGPTLGATSDLLWQLAHGGDPGV